MLIVTNWDVRDYGFISWPDQSLLNCTAMQRMSVSWPHLFVEFGSLLSQGDTLPACNKANHQVVPTIEDISRIRVSMLAKYKNDFRHLWIHSEFIEDKNWSVPVTVIQHAQKQDLPLKGMQQSLKHLWVSCYCTSQRLLCNQSILTSIHPPPCPTILIRDGCRVFLLESISIAHTADPGKDLPYSHWRVCLNSQKALTGSLKCGSFLLGLPAVCAPRQLDPCVTGLSEPYMRTCSFIIPLQTVGLMTNRGNELLSAVRGLPSRDPTNMHKIQNHKNSDKPHTAPPPCGSTQTRPTISMMDFSPDTLFLAQPN